MSLQEMKEAIASLPPHEQAELAAWLEAQQQPLSGETPPSTPVPYARIAHLAGIHKGGQADLARNKRHLEGLGASSMR